MTTAGTVPDTGSKILGGAGGGLFLLVHGGERSRVVELPERVKLTVGRSRAAALSFPADERLSREHVVIERIGDAVEVHDQTSRNGTRLNGRPVIGLATAGPGDAIEAGGVMMIVARRAPRRANLIATEWELGERLEGEVYRAQRYGRTLTLVMLRIDGSTELVDRALDRVAESIRPIDLIAEYGEREQALLLPETTGEGGRRVAERLVKDAREAGVATIAIGLAAMPEQASSAGELVAQARSALRSARRSGQVELAVAAPQSARAEAPIAEDPRSRQTFELARKVATAPITVLILGETGVGKEVVAELIHQDSPRRERPFVRLDCASLPATLLESELFGHERGAFTGAERRKLGYFEAATGGTLFLDEIGELGAALQAKLLTALERRVITRLGSTEEIPVDVRLVAATHRDLTEEVRLGRFREDLYYRLAVFTLFVPPLRDRPADVAPLSLRFAREFALELGQEPPTLGAEARAALERHDWPGNVRELRNAIERAVVLTQAGEIALDALPDLVRQRAAAASPEVALDGRMPAQLQELERHAIVGALEATAGNQTHAARRLGISRRALIYKMERFGLKPPPRSR